MKDVSLEEKHNKMSLIFDESFNVFSISFKSRYRLRFQNYLELACFHINFGTLIFSMIDGSYYSWIPFDFKAPNCTSSFSFFWVITINASPNESQI